MVRGKRVALQGFAELDRHFVAAGGDGAGADDFGEVFAGGVAVGFGLDSAELSDGEGLAEEEGGLGKRAFAGHDVVGRAVAEGVDEDESGLGLDGASGGGSAVREAGARGVGGGFCHGTAGVSVLARGGVHP